MARPKNYPVDISKGASKKVTFAFSDKPDLRAAIITFTVKIHDVDMDAILVKGIDTDLSNNLINGEFIVSFTSDETKLFDVRTHVYEVKIQTDTDTFIPLIGDFRVFGSLSL